MKVSASEHGLVRLFAVDLPPNEIAAFATPDPDGSQGWPLRDALGATQLNPDYVECFDLADLDDLGLTGYMEQGLGIAPKDIAQDALQLGALKGPVLVVLSSAFGGTAQELTPKAPLRWIGTYAEEGHAIAFEPLDSKAAQGSLTPAAPNTPANPHLTVLWAVLALPVLAAVLFGLSVLLKG